LRRFPTTAFVPDESREGQLATTSVEGSHRALPRIGKAPTVGLIAGAIVVLLALAAFIYDHSRRDVIAKGVRIAGVPVGGLHANAARTKLEHDLVARLNEPVTVRAGHRKWSINGQQADLRVNVDDMVEQAVDASRSGSIFSRTGREVFGGTVHRDVPLVVSYSQQAVHKLTKRVRAGVDRPPKDATVEPGASGLVSVPAKVGLTVESKRFAARVGAALTSSAPTRNVTVPTRKVQPAVTTAQLAKKYPAYIVVDRSTFRLRFYSHLKLAKTYEIAVGMEGLETPAGLHHIEWEQVDPPWYVPKKAWAGALAGTVVPPGPGDPLKARFMSFEGGAGIHGIDPSEYSSIGHDASHGCVRMRIPDVIALYDVSPVGTPVYII
jgi:lipoprotein-anchoring transpeptidase ErfK/SrfK